MDNFEVSCKTSTGKEFEIRFMGSIIIGDVNYLNIEIIGKSMIDIVPVFSNPSETITLYECVEGNESNTFVGYTMLTSVYTNPDNGNLVVTLCIPQK